MISNDNKNKNSNNNKNNKKKNNNNNKKNSNNSNIYIFLWSPEDSAGRVMHLKCMIEISVQGVCRQCQQYCVSSGGATVVQGLCAKLFGQLYYTYRFYTHIYFFIYTNIYT